MLGLPLLDWICCVGCGYLLQNEFLSVFSIKKSDFGAILVFCSMNYIQFELCLLVYWTSLH